MPELIRQADPEDVAGVALVSVTAPVMLVGRLARVPPVITRSVADVGFSLVAFGVVVPVMIVGALIEASVAKEFVDRPLEDVSDATGTVDEVEVARIETVPDKPRVAAAFASALAVRGKPKTLQIFATAPKVATRDEHNYVYDIRACCAADQLTLLAINSGASLIDTGIEAINVDRAGAQAWPFRLSAACATDVCYAWELENNRNR